MASQSAESRTLPSPAGGESIERQQEELLRSKYPTVGLKGSAILQKKMQSKVKYFDSGDYNMALSKQMALAKAKHGTGAAAETVNNVNTQNAPLSQKTVTSSENTSGGIQSQEDPSTLTSLQSISAGSTAVVKDAGSTNVAAHPRDAVDSGRSSLSGAGTPHQHNIPPVAVMLTATPAVAQELLQQQVSHSSEDDSNAPSSQTRNTRMSRSESIREVTGDTMPTPDNVGAIARKKSLLHQQNRPLTFVSSSPPGGAVNSLWEKRPSLSEEFSGISN